MKRISASVSSILVLASLVLPVKSGLGQQLDIFSDSSGLLESIGSAIGCDLSARLKADMPVDPLYVQSGTQCLPQVPQDSGTYYTDSGCREAIAFSPTSQQQFCAGAIDDETLGNGATIVEQQWTLSPGTRYDVGAASLQGLTQPYQLSRVYRRVDSGNGDCQLEMRIYKNNPGEANQKPLIALHGGSWSSRGFGLFGIEATVARYTARGFTVFAPFYRLLGDSQGPSQCNGASLDQIVDDVAAALDWVDVNSGGYGATGKPVVFGQSAGAHLALSLAVNQSDRIAGAVLLYPPTDFEDFVLRAQAGEYVNPEGLGILSKVLGSDVTGADISKSPIPENTFPAIVASQPQAYPPMYIVHGLADELVPASQSIRLCNALAGIAVDLLLDVGDELSQVMACGSRSELHLFAEGNHALDICLSTSILLRSSCLSGSAQSKSLVADSLNEASRWSESVAKAANTASESSSDSGGGAAHFLLLIVLFSVNRYRERRPTVASRPPSC